MFSDFGKKIELLQADKGMSNAKLAEKIGKKPQNMAKLKRASRPRKETIKKLSLALEVPVKYFFNFN